MLNLVIKLLNMRIFYFFLFVSLFSNDLHSQLLNIEFLANGFEIPVDLTNAGDDRLFVVEKRGRVKFINKDGEGDITTFIDISDRVNSGANERGLLGLAFHPNFETNGSFFLSYTQSNGASVISRFYIRNDGLGDPNSEQVLMTVSQPFNNHNGGCIKFGPDGYLYIGFGDGGAAGDPQNNSQNRMSLLGKMLRIDVDNGDPYAIPEDNPFAFDDFTADEIWSLGLRNPWRFSFDRMTGDLWIGDVGQDAFEEIDFRPANSTGGENYGWKCYEGNQVFSNVPECPNITNVIFPVYEYKTDENILGCSVTGGYVYRGSEYPALFGRYIFADFCTGQLWHTTPNDCGSFETVVDIRGGFQEYSSFGEDNNGELYVMALSEGAIYRIVASCDVSMTAETTTHQCFGPESGTILLNIQGEGDINTSLPAGYDPVSGTVDAPGCYCFGLVEGQSGCDQTLCVNVEADNTVPDLENVVILEGQSCEAISVQPIDYGYPYNIYRNDTLIAEETYDLIEITQSGTYSIQLVNGECLSPIYDIIIHTIMDLERPTVIWDENAFLRATPGFFSYIWLNEGIEFATTSEDSLYFNENGNVSVIGVDANGCESEASEEIEVIVSSLEELNITHLVVSPNPFDNKLSVELSFGSYNNGSVQLVSGHGKLIESRILKNRQDHYLTFDTDGLAQGMYFLQIYNQGKVFTEKMTKL
jgi:glucose/arabinose dehydrogenase